MKNLFPAPAEALDPLLKPLTNSSQSQENEVEICLEYLPSRKFEPWDAVAISASAPTLEVPAGGR